MVVRKINMFAKRTSFAIDDDVGPCPFCHAGDDGAFEAQPKFWGKDGKNDRFLPTMARTSSVGKDLAEKAGSIWCQVQCSTVQWERFGTV